MIFLEIQENQTLSCSEKLDKVQDGIRKSSSISPGELYHLSEIIKQCVNQEHAGCLETVFLIAKETSLQPSSDLRHGLKAIGDNDIAAVNQFIKQKIQNKNASEAHFLAKIVPHLYRGQEDEMANQMQDWYDTYRYFFFRALERTLQCFLGESSGHGAKDFNSEIRPIKNKLEEIAQANSIEPDDAYQDKNYQVVKLAILLDDLEWINKHPINYTTVENNLLSYPHLEAVLNLNSSAITDLKQHNTHPLTNLLTHCLKESQVKQIENDQSATQDEQREAKQSLGRIQKLSYYDHCLELIAPGNGQNSDPTTRLKDDLLKRQGFESTVAEIEVFNVLRRQFGIPNVAIERKATNSTKEPDAKITVNGETIWVEVTLPQPQPSYEVAQRFSYETHPQKSDARRNVTRKLDDQIIDIKNNTEELTMLVIKNADSRLDDETVKDYVEGELKIAIPNNQSGADPILFRGDKSGLQYDDVTDHLDILVNFKTLNDLSAPPFIEGQIADLTNVDQSIIDQLADAFNAQTLTPP